MNEPFQPGDIVQFKMNTSLGGQQRTVKNCQVYGTMWKVNFTAGGWQWSDDLELVTPASGPPINQPVQVSSWPMGYCDNAGYPIDEKPYGNGHLGEHPLYTSSDGGCTNFVTSERLLEIKQLFDLTIENQALRDELEDFYYLENTPRIDFDSWIHDERMLRNLQAKNRD